MTFKIWQSPEHREINLRLIEDDGCIDLCMVDDEGTSVNLILSISEKKVILFRDKKDLFIHDMAGYPIIEFR